MADTLYRKAKERAKADIRLKAVAVIQDRQGNTLKTVAGNLIFLNASLMLGQLWASRTRRKQVAYLALAEGQGDVIRIFRSNGYRCVSDVEEVTEPDLMLNEAEVPWSEVLCDAEI